MAPTKPADHENCRGKVCLICLRKSDRQVNPGQIETIRKHSDMFKTIQPFDHRIPTGICRVCVTDLSHINDPKKPNPVLKRPSDFCFSKEVVIPPKTRSNSGDYACSCLICKIGKANPVLVHPYYQVPFNKIFKKGAKRKSEPKEKFQFDNSLPYEENLKRFKIAEPKKAEQYAGQILKEKESSPGGTIYMSQRHGKPFPCSLGKKQKIEKAVFTHDEMEDLATKQHMSQRQIRNLSAFINRKPQCKTEAGLQKELPVRNRLLDDFYTGEMVEFFTSDDPKKWEVIKRPMVYCKSAQELIFQICEIRDIDWHLFKIQVFLDAGGDMLKLSCVIKPVIVDPNEKAGRKSSGVNQLIPLAFCPKCPENYPNFRIFFEKTLIWAVSFFMSVDLKVKNIVLGMQNAAAYYPCTECKTPRKEFCKAKKTGDSRTISDLAHDYERFESDQAKRKDGAQYYNVIHLPLFAETLEEMKSNDLPVRDFCPPSPLHYNLGIVELYHDKMEEKWPEAVKYWVKKSLAIKSDNPKMKFEGNQCIKLLESLYVFYDGSGTAKIGEMIPYLNCLSSYDEMRKFSFNCDDHIDVDLCRKKIEKFTADSLVLFEDFDVNAINKLHACHVHVMEWIEEYKMGLGNVDEQTGESCHQDFKKFCNGRLMENIDDPGYLECLRKLVVEYASKHRKSKLCIE